MSDIDDLNKTLKERFKYHITFFTSWVLAGIFFGLWAFLSSLSEETNDTNWYVIPIIAFVSSLFLAVIATLYHIFSDRFLKKSPYSKPFKGFIQTGFKAENENIFGIYNNYPVNMGWVFHHPKLKQRTIIIRVYHKPSTKTAKLNKKHNWSKAHEAHKIYFFQDYVQFNYGSPIGRPSSKKVKLKIDQIIRILQESGVEPIDSSKVKYHHISNTSTHYIEVD